MDPHQDEDIRMLLSRYGGSDDTQVQTDGHIILEVPTEERENTISVIEARLHYKTSLLSASLRRWVLRLEELNETKARSEGISHEFYNQKLTFTFFRAWQWRFQQRIRAHQNWELAVRNNVLTMMARPFLAWRRQAINTRRQRESLAELYHAAASATAARCWLRWSHFWHRKKMGKELEKLSCYRLAKRYLRRWTNHQQQRRNQLMIWSVLQMKKKQFMLASCFITWIRVSFAKQIIAIAHRQHALTTVSVNATLMHTAERYRKWRTFARNKELQKSLTKLQLFTVKCKMASAFSLWLRWQQANALANAYILKRMAALSGTALARWASGAKRVALDRSKWRLAVSFRDSLDSQALALTFRAWRHVCAHRRYMLASTEAAMGLRQDLLVDVGMDVLRRHAASFFGANHQQPKPMLRFDNNSNGPSESSFQLESLIKRQRSPLPLNGLPKPQEARSGPEQHVTHAAPHTQLGYKLRRRVAEYTIQRSEEAAWAGQLKDLLREYQLCKALLATDLTADSQASLASLESQIEDIRTKQKALSDLRDEIVYLRNRIAATLSGKPEDHSGDAFYFYQT